MFTRSVSPTNKVFPAFLLGFMGLCLVAVSYQHFENLKSAHQLYAFSQAQKSGLVPVDCRRAYGQRDVDFISAYGSAAFHRTPKKSAYLYACWYPIHRFVEIYKITGDVVEAVRQQYSMLEFERVELKPAEIQYWPLAGIPLGLLIFLSGVTVPFLRNTSDRNDDSENEVVAPLDPLVLQSELLRLRQRLDR